MKTNTPLIEKEVQHAFSVMNFNLFCVRGVFGIILLVGIHGLLLDTCSSDGDCPVPATCKPNGCKGFDCLCPPHTVVDETLNFCQNASQIGSRCDNDTRCLSKMAVCESNICRCADFFRTTRTLQCSFKDERLIGENCSRSSECADSKSVCLEGSCVCAQGFREKTEDEYWADPLSRIQCVSVNFSLDYCGLERLVLPVKTTPSSPDVEAMTVPDTTNSDIDPSEIKTDASDANFINTLYISLQDIVMPSETLLPSATLYIHDTVMASEALLPSQTFLTSSNTPDLPFENTVQVETLLPSELHQSLASSDYDNSLITNSEIWGSTTLGDAFTEHASDVIDNVTSDETPEIGVTESEVFEQRGSDDIAPTETYTVTPSARLVEDFTRTDVENTSPSDLKKDTNGNNNTSGNKENSSNSNVAITDEDVKIIISLLGSGVGILVVLTIIVVLFKLCRTGTTMSNTVSPEPQDNSSVLKSVNRQRTLFKDRW